MIQRCIIFPWLFSVYMDRDEIDEHGDSEEGSEIPRGVEINLASCMQMTRFCVVSRRRA